MSNAMRFITDLSKGILGDSDDSSLWSKIIGHIPDAVLLKPGVRILNVSCGHGTEADILVKRMRALGISAEDVNDSMYLLDKYRVFTNRAVRKGYKNVIAADFLEWKTDMKFDVIIGNPPYQAPKKGDYSFWARFVDAANSLLNKDGYLSMVIPAGWMSPTNDIRQGQKSVLRDIFAKNRTTYINVDPSLGKTYFNGIGQKFSWFTLQNAAPGTTILDFGPSTFSLNLADVYMLAKEPSEINTKIISKLTSKLDKWAFTRYIMKESWDDISFDSLPSHPFIRINGNSNHLDKICYSKNPCRYQIVPKVVLPYNGSNYKFVVDSGIEGCTNAYVQPLNKNDLMSSAEVYFGSKLIKWLGTNKFTQYNEGALINAVGKMDLTIPITEQDVYKFYGLTQEEIEYVEANVK